MSGTTKAAESAGVRHPGSEVQETGAGEPSLAAEIAFDKIQGNIFGGFLKDHQINIFLKITDHEKAITTLRPQVNGTDVPDGIFTHVKHSSSKDVLAFNEQFKALRRAGLKEGTIQATWTNLVVTAAGIRALGVKDVVSLPEAFRGDEDLKGMIARAQVIGDVDGDGVTNGPAHWNDGMDVRIDWAAVHALVIVASDDPDQLDRCQTGSRAARYLSRLEAPGSGVQVLGVIRGETRVDDVGHEHFGFKDGVSQPGVRGVDSPDDPLHNPNQGNPGQDLLQPGEFVVGYPRQKDAAKDGVDGPNPDPGPDSADGLPEWAKNGSFLVFRRLAQDVRGFREAVRKTAAHLGISADLLARNWSAATAAAPARGAEVPVRQRRIRAASDRPGNRAPRPGQQ